MYIGRCVVVGRLSKGQLYTGYRVSARSHPHRRMQVQGATVQVVPDEGITYTNPYVSYNCLRAWETDIVVGNGTQTDPILEKVQRGYPLRDAIGLTLLALDLTPVRVPGETVAELAQACYELAYTHPVTACAGWIADRRLEVAIYPTASAR